MIRLLAAVFLGLFCLAAPLHAQDRVKELDAKFEEQLKKYDPGAVKAARSYAQNFDTRAQLQGMSASMRPGLINLVRSKNPEAKDADLEIFFEEFFRVALVESAPVIEKWTILNMLEVLTTEEVIAADKFYSTPVGKSLMAKMPQMMARMPQMMGLMEQTFIPAGIAAAQAKLRKLGKDFKI
ncbi:MAG: DUF2059 domain-containing protein [Methylobacterium sp.]|nr:DUF2059 domain-containing protein [Methylobacterium sp.]MCA3638015.1 DUF2059 domain-containing protein [Methylobacterium sp.]MCZ8270987.1 DUF2059 domain-containing protein [Beijerinckiaceae bacterium]